MHIAFLGEGDALGGVSEVVFNLNREFLREGVHSLIVSIADGTFVDQSNVYYFSKQSCFVSFVESFKPDIVVFHSIYELKQIPYSMYCTRHGIPYVVVFHGGASRDNAKKHWFRKKIANILFYNRYIKNAKRVIYLNKNERMKSVFVKINDRYSIIPNGINLPKTVYKYEEVVTTISFISRLDYYGKGLDILLPVIKRLANEGWNDKLHFNFYGQPDLRMINRIAEIGEIASYKGFVKGKEKNNAFSDSDIIILPSRSEGMPMTILEALSYGKPCIITEMTNMADVVTENNCGWVTELTEDDIYHCIISAYYDQKVMPEKYYSNCIKTAKQFEWKNVAKKSLLLYQEILKENA